MSFRSRISQLTKVLTPIAILAAGFLYRPAPSVARPDYTRRTKQECSYCHLPGGWYLTDAGKYFEKNRSLNGYKPAPEPAKQTIDQKAATPDNQKTKPK
jgi:hypothetical protein